MNLESSKDNEVKPSVALPCTITRCFSSASIVNWQMKRKLGFRRLLRKTSLNCSLEESLHRLTNMKWLCITNMEWLCNTVTANEINGRCQLDDFWQMFVFLRGPSSTSSYLSLLVHDVYFISKGGTKFHKYKDETECWG